MKKNALAILAVVSFFTVGQVSAQSEPEFPLTINGQECASKADCKLLCDDPVNYAACAELGGQKTSDPFQDPTLVEAATQQLGCSTLAGCEAVCSLAANFEKCAAFAKKYKLPGGYDERTIALHTFLEEGNVGALGGTFSEEEQQQLVALQAKMEEEGTTLQEYCDDESHQVACSNIAETFGLKGGKRLAGPGGCETAETCRAYCDDPSNFAECRSFEVPGLNGCASELACYSEAQANPSQLKTIVKATDTVQAATESTFDSQQILTACQSSLDIYEGKSTADLAQDFERSNVCQVLPQSGIPGQNNNCDAYLNANQPFNKSVFEKICSITTVAPGKELPKVANFSDLNNLDSYTSWCDQLPSIGQAESDWQVVPQICTNFVSTFKEARGYCDAPAEQRPDWLKDDVALSRYCLSAPENFSDYAQSCEASSSECQTGGYDWYCQQTGKSCVPLYQGTPINQAVNSFSDAGLIKDGEIVTVVLSDTTKDFAQEVLAQTVAQTGAAGTKIEVVSEVPKTVSPNAVFAAGVGSKQGRNGQGSSQAFFLKPVKTEQKTTEFQQPWYAIDAKITDPNQTNRQPQVSNRPVVSPQPNQQDQQAAGWQLIRTNQQSFTNLQPVKPFPGVSGVPQRIEQNGPIRPIDSTLLKSVISNPAGTLPPPGISPIPAGVRTEPVVTPTLRTVTPAGTTTNTYKSPTPYIPPSGSTAGSTGQTAPNPQPTTYILPTQPSTYQSPTNTYVPPPTQPPQTQTNTGTSGGTTTTTTSGGTTTTTTTGGSVPPPSPPPPGVQGVHTEENVWAILRETVMSIFN